MYWRELRRNVNRRLSPDNCAYRPRTNLPPNLTFCWTLELLSFADHGETSRPWPAIKQFFGQGRLQESLHLNRFDFDFVAAHGAAYRCRDFRGRLGVLGSVGPVLVFP
jgi:hypothetical protein